MYSLERLHTTEKLDGWATVETRLLDEMKKVCWHYTLWSIYSDSVLSSRSDPPSNYDHFAGMRFGIVSLLASLYTSHHMNKWPMNLIHQEPPRASGPRHSYIWTRMATTTPLFLKQWEWPGRKTTNIEQSYEAWVSTSISWSQRQTLISKHGLGRRMKAKLRDSYRSQRTMAFLLPLSWWSKALTSAARRSDWKLENKHQRTKTTRRCALIAKRPWISRVSSIMMARKENTAKIAWRGIVQ